MTDQEYEHLKKRLLDDVNAWIGQQALNITLLLLEWSFKGLGAALPLLIEWFKKHGYLQG